MNLAIAVELKEDAINILKSCDSFEDRLITTYRKPVTRSVESALAFIRLLRMLVQAKISPQVLIDRIEKAPQLHMRPWLKEKAAQYKKK